MSQTPIEVLGASVATLGEAVQGMEGELPVLVCAVAALVRTHPDGQAFASEFRRAWLQLGSPNQALAADDPTGDRMRSLLDVLEASCQVPLNIRPPER
ncbi:MAG: hypothetical protein PHX69_08915 [Simplicispira sp.]|uniref:hypothetical protein n=1 Tax=Simplicispira sp. TaxID=2015802 RepID=UPI00258C484D|nr:hypothetical protein [Simplicispira sp.]MDD2691885.1 hypothetical protein [Simplicispira sp.]